MRFIVFLLYGPEGQTRDKVLLHQKEHRNGGKGGNNRPALIK